MPPITSATTEIDGPLPISWKSVVSAPPGGGYPRSFPGARTSAFTTRRRWPVARSMSSADSVSRRLTAAPTVPYPSSATDTSTDAMNLRSLLPHVQGAKSCTDLLDLRLRQLRAVLLEHGLAAVH